MQIALDTVCVSKLLRNCDKSRLRRKTTSVGCTTIDPPIEKGTLRLAVDKSFALIHQWEKTCGEEAVRALVTNWESKRAFLVISPLPSIPHAARGRLRAFGFTDTIDKLVLKLAFATVDKIVVSDDSDFWDPTQPGRRGDPRSPVAAYFYNHLGVRVWTLAILVAKVK